MSFFIVSGLSGSGKTIALQALEDAGFYCIDNLPAALLPHFAGQIASGRHALQNTAIGIDARNRAFLADVPQSLKQLQTLGIQYRVVFLEAEEPILVKRFKETRRKHPMTDDATPLLEAIRLEKQLLEPLSFAAGLRIDTTHTTPHELRQQVAGFRARRGDTGHDAVVRVVRLQARHAAGCGLRLRCTLSAQPLLATGTAPVHRARRAGDRIHAALRRGGGDVRRDSAGSWSAGCRASSARTAAT